MVSASSSPSTHGHPIDGVDDEYISKQLAPVTPDIDSPLFRKYVAYAKRTCFPMLTPEASDALIEYYMKLRAVADSNNPVPITARQLEALVRLAEASATDQALEQDREDRCRPRGPYRRYLSQAGRLRREDRAV